jgi:hypothetical protein
MVAMKQSLVAVLAAAAAANKNGQQGGVTPITKVLQMLESMKAKAIDEKKAEEVRFSAFNQWCADTSAEKATSIEDLGLSIDKLDGEISAAEEEVIVLGKDVKELQEDIGRWAQDSKSAATVRGKEHTDFLATQGEYMDTLDACERAIVLLKSMQQKVPQSLLQLSAKAQPSEVTNALAPLLQTVNDSPNNVPGAIVAETPDAYAYETQSGSVVGMLKGLRDRFRQELTDLQKEDMVAKNAFEDVAQRMRDQTNLASQDEARRAELQGKRREEAAQKGSEKKEAEAMKAEDEKYLADLKTLCSQKSNDFGSRQELREGEIDAIAKAIEIIGSDAVSADRLPGGGSAAAGASSSFAQLRSTKVVDLSPKQKEAASLLHERAQALGSDVLALAAKRAAEDPFAKVSKMIKDLLVKLREQAVEETSHKGWCDTELGTNEVTRKHKGEEVDDLYSESEALTAKAAKLAQEIADLNSEVLEIDKAVAKAKEERAEESKENAACITDAQQSRAAVANALAVLREFYAKAGEAVALVQRSRQSPLADAPETFDASFQGQQGESTGVFGMLEVIESDFARLEAETDTAEQVAADEHRKFLGESSKNKAVAETSVEHNSGRLQETNHMLSATQRSLEATQQELDAANAYYNKLKPTCVDSGVTYEERVKRRKDELESLKDAYTILSNGEEVGTLSEMRSAAMEVR